MTAAAAAAAAAAFVRLFDYCTGGRRTKLPKDPNIGLAELAHYYRLFLPYKAGGMGLVDPHMLRHTAYLGCWTSLLTGEGAVRWKRSFPGLANMCTDRVLGDGQGRHARGAPTAFGGRNSTGDLLAELRDCQRFVANPSCRKELPCPHGAPPVVGAQAHAAHRKAPRAGGINHNQGHNSPSTSTASKLTAAWHAESPISFQDLENTDGARGTKAGQHQLSMHAQRHVSKLILKALLDNIGNHPEPAAMSLVRTHASIVAGSAPNAATSFTSIPSDPRSTLTNAEWQINTQLRLGTPLASYYNQPHALCPHGCRHPQTKENVNVRYGWHLATDCRKANQGKKSHKDVEWTIIHYFNTYTSITATKAKPFPGGKQADILLSGITTIDNPAGRNWYLDVTSTNPMGVTNQEFISRAELGRQPGPGEHDPRNDVLTSAKRAEERKHTKYDAICAATGAVFSPFALETTGGHGASTASVYFLFNKHMRDSGLPADVLLGKFKRDVSFALRRGTIAQVTTALDAGQRAAEDELALNVAG